MIGLKMIIIGLRKMIMNKKYTLEKLEDVLNIPPERFDDFLVEFKSWYTVVRGMKELIKTTATVLGTQNIEIKPQKMVWIDNKKTDIKINIETVDDNGNPIP